MSGIIKKINSILKHRSTYSAGLLQTRAYRELKVWTGKSLKESGISTADWALLGLLFETKSGMRPSELATSLGVEAPFITERVRVLSKKNFIYAQPDSRDSRVKYLALTDSGIQFITKTETRLRNEIKPLFKDISVNELSIYLMVLEKIVENADTLHKNESS